MSLLLTKTKKHTTKLS